MSAYIHKLATAVPATACRQADLASWMQYYMGEDAATRRFIDRTWPLAGVERRHTVLPDFEGGSAEPLFFPAGGGTEQPGTEARNQLYEEHAGALCTRVARSLLDGQPPTQAQRISHVITVSCTGFTAPGPEQAVIRALGLSRSTRRYHLGFMGCYAALPALDLARSICEAEPSARVLVLSVELCTLHLQPDPGRDNLVSAALFADGAAGALVCAEEPVRPGFRIEATASLLTEEASSEMAWTLGDTGFRMTLSKEVPAIIEANLHAALQPLLTQLGEGPEAVDAWALHPGGRPILDGIERSLDLRPEHTEVSRRILANYGNMSSASILFVLAAMLDRGVDSPGRRILALACGPGLAVESMRLTGVGGRR